MITTPFAPLLAIVGLSIADMGTTLALLNYFPLSHESNPVMRLVIQESSILFIAIKLLVPAIGIVFLSNYWKNHKKLYRITSNIIILMLSLVVINNGSLLITV